MGYEVEYKYYKEIEKGEYNRDEVMTNSIGVGTPYEEVSLDVLAGKIMALLARRSILVFGVSINEFVKKEISFRETDNGIVIKNRKFKFDDTPVTGEDMGGLEEQIAQALKENPNLLEQILNKNNMPAVRSNLASPIRYEIFDPEPRLKSEASKFRFTTGRKYPIYKEELEDGDEALAGLLYTTTDDDGNTQKMSDKLFIPERKPLMKEMRSDPFDVVGKGLNDSGLNWGKIESGGMPAIR